MIFRHEYSSTVATTLYRIRELIRKRAMAFTELFKMMRRSYSMVRGGRVQQEWTARCGGGGGGMEGRELKCPSCQVARGIK